jgi:hypothetical protein
MRLWHTPCKFCCATPARRRQRRDNLGFSHSAGPGVIERLFADSGFVGVEQRTLALPLRMPPATQALAMMQEAFGAYRAVVSDRPEAMRVAAWAEVAETLKTFETPTGFIAPAEVLVAAGVKPA